MRRQKQEKISLYNNSERDNYLLEQLVMPSQNKVSTSMHAVGRLISNPVSSFHRHPLIKVCRVDFSSARSRVLVLVRFGSQSRSVEGDGKSGGLSEYSPRLSRLIHSSERAFEPRAFPPRPHLLLHTSIRYYVNYIKPVKSLVGSFCGFLSTVLRADF